MPALPRPVPPDAPVLRRARPRYRAPETPSSERRYNRYVSVSSAGLTMWQMWQMPRASGLRGASGNREKNFQRDEIIASMSYRLEWLAMIGLLSRVSKGARANNCHGPRLALIRHCPQDFGYGAA